MPVAVFGHAGCISGPMFGKENFHSKIDLLDSGHLWKDTQCVVYLVITRSFAPFLSMFWWLLSITVVGSFWHWHGCFCQNVPHYYKAQALEWFNCTTILYTQCNRAHCRYCVAVTDQKLGVYPHFMEVPQSASSMEPSVNKISRNLIVPYYL